MIKRLQRRMILLVLCGLLLASAGLVAAINWINWNSLETQAHGILDLLAENDGQRPLMLDTERRDFDGQEPPVPLDEEQDRNSFFRDRKNRGDLRSATSLSSYFTAELDEDGAVCSWFSDRAELYTDDGIADLAAQIISIGKDSGRIDTQFYRLVSREKGKLLIVVDQSLAMLDARRVLR
ncbi:MAG: hypothetical protein IJU12_05870, partial [Clostridia bacterium]|nr:hypothetical protein [Clostridia bacterium]